MIKAIFFDIDGTIFSHTDKKIPQSTKDAIKKLRDKQIKCIIATGRHLLELKDLNITDIEFDGYITLNGQLCLDACENVTESHPIEGLGKEAILSLFNGKELPVILVEKDRMYINFVDHRVRHAQEAVSTDIPETGHYTGNPIYLAIAYVNPEEERQLKDQLPECDMTRWSHYGVDVLSEGGDKTSGIRHYLKSAGISPDEIMAFGDGENDIQMLKFAGIGVAMGNAEAEVKQAADYITDDIDHDGLKKALEHYGLLP